MLRHLNKPFIIIILLTALPFFAYCQLPVPQWVNDLGGSGDSKPTGLITDNQNNIYVTGYFSGTVDFDPSAGVKNLTSVGGYDIYVAKYTPAGALVWAVSMGGDGLDQANYMTVDNNGNPTIIGQFQSTTLNAGAFSLPNQGAEDIFIIHLDVNGNVVWAKSMGGSQTDRGEEVNADAQGNLFVTSIYQSTLTVGPSITAQGGGFNALIVKYDVSGNLLWNMSLGSGAGDTEVYGNQVDASGNFVVSGTFSGTVDFDPLGVHHNLTSNGNDNGFVAKYTPAGTLIWVAPVNGSFVNDGSAVSVDSNNDIYLTGAFTSPLVFNGGGFTLNASGFQDTFIAKYSSNGTYQFAKDIGGAGAGSFVYQARSDPNNNDLYITGYFTGTIDFDPSAGVALVSDHGQRDFYVAKYGPNGNYIWAFSGGSPNCNLSLGIELGVDHNSNVIAGGSFCSTVNFDPSHCSVDNVTAINGTSDTYIAKYTPSSTPTITNNTITAPAITTFCGNTDPSVIAASTPTGGSGIYTYQWQSSPDNVTFTDIAGATAITYDPPVISTSTYYHRVVSSACALPSTSNAIELIIQPALAGNAVTAPAVTTFCTSGDPAVINASAATGGNGTYSYQWQSSPDNVTFTDIAGATAISYDPPVINATTYYRRTVTSGACTTPFVSNAIAINIQPALANNTLDSQPVTTFCGQYGGPPQTGGAGVAVDLTASTPTGGDGTYSYQWQSSPDNVTFTNIAGATSSDFLLPKTTVTTYFRRMVTSGACAHATGKQRNREIIIQPVLASNTLTTPAVTSFCGSGDPAVITGTTPTGGSGTYTYQWQSSPDNVTFSNIAGATSANYDPPVINATTYYQRVVTSGSCSTPFVSNVVSIIVNAVPSPPLSSTTTPNICAGGTVTITIGSPQPGLTYDWYDSPTKTNHLFTGVSYTTLPLFANTTFYVGATNGTCSSASLGNITVNVSAIPAQPAVTSSQVTVCNGSSASLSISNPQAGITYNWYATATGGTTVFTGADFYNAGGNALSGLSYYAEAANAGGCVSAVRTPVTVAVNPVPQVAAQGASVCPGTSATLTASSTDPNATINWYTSANGGGAVFTGTTFTTPVLNANATYYAGSG